MRLWGFLCIIAGIAGIGLGGMMFGDIGVAAVIAGAVGLFSGFGILSISGKLKKLSQ